MTTYWTIDFLALLYIFQLFNKTTRLLWPILFRPIGGLIIEVLLYDKKYKKVSNCK